MQIKRRFFLGAATVAFVLISVFSAYQYLSSQPSKYENRKVNKIEIKGLKNVDEDDVFEVMLTTEGYPVKSAEVREDIKQIFALGYFNNVKFEIDEDGEGVKIRVVVEERPVIEKIVFKGYDELLETDLLAAMRVKEGEVYRKDLIEESVKQLKDKYNKEGYFNAYITYKVKDSEDDGGVKVEIIIDEGEEIKVRKFAILGATKIYVEELFDLVETKEDTIFSDGSFKREVYEEDKRKIVGYYQQEGYIDAQIVDENFEYEWVDPVDKDERGIYIVLKLSEGEKYYFDGEYTINFAEGKSNVLSRAEIEALKKSFQLKEKGEVFNNSKFQADRQSISFLYASKGYIFARVIPQRNVTEREVKVDGKIEKRKFVKIDFMISEGKKAHIEQIIIKGNKKTKDKVIRRELVIREGMLFNSSLMQISREKVFNLGYFKEVNFDVRPGTKEGFMNLIV
ncbi:MAG TPA: POTRA domain-containing protein, partial [Spirochaetota bacterium]|nr:POTRA domain-containing protein [Spirochaetota bacterium]